VQAFRDAFAEILNANDRHLLPPYLADAGFTSLICSKYREAHQSFIESRTIRLETVEQNPYLSNAYRVGHGLVPMSLVLLGEWGEALREIKDAIAMWDKYDHFHWGQAMRLNRARVHLHAMDFAGVLTICDSVLPLVRDPEPRHSPDYPTPFPSTFRIRLILTGLAQAALGDYESALEHFQATRVDMDRRPSLLDWYWGMHLEFAATDLWLAKGDLAQARPQAERFLKFTLATAEHTWQALAWEVNARVAMAELDLTRAQDCIANGLSAMEGFDVPLGAWRLHATAAELYQLTESRELAERHLALSRDTIMKLANSLPAEEPLRHIFLSAPMIRKILDDSEVPGLRAKKLDAADYNSEDFSSSPAVRLERARPDETPLDTFDA